MSEWRPIETAPRDGTKVLLCEADQPTEIVLGWWLQNAWRDYGDIGCGGFDDYNPTHWMPLPEPPSDDVAVTDRIVPVTVSTKARKA